MNLKRLILCDLAGKVVQLNPSLSTLDAQTYQISSAGLSSGMYILKIEYDDSSTNTFKLVKK